MINRAVASRYARALFDAALEASTLEEIDSQFPQLVDFISGSDDFQDFITHPTIGDEEKKSANE